LGNPINPEKRSSRRGVSVIIGSLLLVAIAVVGSTMIFGFSQGFFNQAQISGAPTIESVQILGYDARDVTELNVHNGKVMADGTAGDPTSLGKIIDEGVAVHIKNDSVIEILLKEIRLGGTVYEYDTSILPLSAWDDTVNLVPGKYFILRDSTTIIQKPIPLVQPGAAVTILIDLDENFQIGRDIQFKLTTAKGTTILGTIIMGQDSI